MAVNSSSSPTSVSVCHDRHINAKQLRRILEKSAVPPRDESRLQKILADDWQPLPCAHFGIWWEDLLFNKLEWANRLTQDASRNAFIDAWLHSGWDMVTRASAYCNAVDTNRCEKGQTLDIQTWIKRFQQAVAVDGQISMTTARNLGSSEIIHRIRRPEQSKLFFTYVECCKVIAEKAREDSSFAPYFLNCAERLSRESPSQARVLLEDAVELALSDLPKNHRCLSDFLAKFEMQNEEEYGEFLRKIDNEIKAISDGNITASIRLDQQIYVPRLHRRPPRPQRKVVQPKLYTVKIFGQGADAPFIQGNIVDVSSGPIGPDSPCGRGIRFRSADWQFETGTCHDDQPIPIYDTKVKRHDILANGAGHIETLAYEGLNACIHWPHQAPLQCRIWMIKAAPYPPWSPVRDGAATFFIEKPTQDMAPVFDEWQRHVLHELPDFSYGRDGLVV